MSEWLKFPIIGQDIDKLERILKLIHPNISKTNKFNNSHKSVLDKMVAHVGGNTKTVKFDELVADITRDKVIFTKTTISTQKPTIFTSANNPFDDINMQHILDKHTIEHFQFTPSNLKKQGGSNDQTIDFFPLGTTQSNVCILLDEAIENAKNTHFGGILPTKAQVSTMEGGEVAKYVTLSNGKTYIIGFTTNSSWKDINEKIPHAGKYIIGQFYPSPATEKRSLKFLEILVLIP